MTDLHLPRQRRAPDLASAAPAPARDAGWARVLLVAGSRAALAVVLSLLVWSLLPAALGWSPRVIMSGSMEPRIHVGDVVVDRPVDPDVLTAGQVLTVTDPDHPEKTRTHRLLERDEAGRLVLQGDANQAPDSTPVEPADVLGVGVVRVPHVGLPVVWLGQGQLVPLGLLVAALVLLGLAATASLRLTAAHADGPGDEDDDDRDDETGGGGVRDAGLGILGPAATHAPTRPASRRGRLAGGVGTAFGAVLAVALTTQVSYAAYTTSTRTDAGFTAAASFDASAYLAAVLGDRPALYWRFEETAGSTATDSSGADRSGTVDRPRWGDAGALVPEPTTRALGLEGGSVTQASTMLSTGVLSLEAWVRTSRPSGGPILTMTVGGQQERALYLGSDGRLRFGRGASSGVTVGVTSPGMVNDGRWHHVVYTAVNSGGAAGTRVRLYVDGALVDSGRNVADTVVQGRWRVGSESWVGSWPGVPDQLFHGSVDEVAVYADALTAGQVAAHHRLGQP